MIRKILLALLICIGSILIPITASANTETGPYLSGGLGLGHLDFSSIGLTKRRTEENHLAGRVTAGYRFNKHWGAAVGYARLGHFKNDYSSGNSTVFYSGTAHATWLALTARLPISSKFALLSDIRLSRNWVATDKQSAQVSQFRRLHDAKTALVLGSLGAEYSVDDKSSLNIQFEGFGEAADAVEAGTLTFNYQYHF